jgi:murein DD-endopeptidase MepM/ murein hydrolase activator NlpD
MRRPFGLGISVLIIASIVVGYLIYKRVRPAAGRMTRLRKYWANPNVDFDWLLHSGERCNNAPFIAPTDGLVGFFWGDSFRPGHKHQGLDIFGPSGPDGLGQTPVIAAYDGYLTRLQDWRSTVIIRIPDDPIKSGRQIWMYYTHMADAEGNSFIVSDFPAGTVEKFVTAGTLLGYQGNYSANPDNPTGMHLHFSIVRDDGQGSYTNELEFRNTLDPTPYLGIEVNANRVGETPAGCAG